jgi:hypothetical protein
VDVNITRYYQCISRCVRRASLCGDGFEHRKQWIEDRLQMLSECFAASVCRFAVMDNHLHVLVRLEPDAANGWSAEGVVGRWLVAYPAREFPAHPRWPAPCSPCSPQLVFPATGL